MADLTEKNITAPDVLSGLQSQGTAANTATPAISSADQSQNAFADIMTARSGSDATDTAAMLLNEQFANWESQFKPIELQAIQMLSWNSPGELANTVTQGEQAAVNSSNAMEGILNRSNAAIGVQPTTEQANTSKRLMDLTKNANVAGAANQARANVRLQDELLLMGATSNPNIVKSSTSG